MRLLALLCVLGLLAVVSFAFGLVRAISSQLPSLDPARAQQLEVNGYIYASDGHTILSVLRGSQARVLVSSNQIAPVMKQAIVAIEDRRFWEHRGIDVRGIMRAIWENLRSSSVVQGGSTITQQFVKNAFVNDQRTLARKLKEAALAWQLEQRWSKDRILTAYLNTIYFGHGAYGIQQAALTYFGHGAADLTLPEAALLAGIPEDPNLYDPAANPKPARDRRDVVLRAMLDEGRILPSEYRRAVATPLPRPQDVRLPGTEGPAQYFVNYVKQELVDRFGSARVFGGGLHVQTSLDLGLQQFARDAISKWLTDANGPSAALVAIDPRDGRILSMIGGNDYRTSQFNLAVQAQRQPGSAFKPFVLAAALREGISPLTQFESKPQLISLGDRFWAVHNYENAYLGWIDLGRATQESDNTVFAQLTEVVGPRAVAQAAHDLGITSNLDDYLAIGLGAESVDPLEMAHAYATIADGGTRVDGAAFPDRPRAIEWVKDAKGGTVADNRPKETSELTSTQASIVTSMLERVVTAGTGAYAALPDRPVAGKTGTTENYGDAWFVGYTPQLAVAVWVGYPTTLKPMLTEFHGKPVVGGSFPALIWKSFMQKALPYLHDDPQQFPQPPYLSTHTSQVALQAGRVLADNGYCAKSFQLVYLTGYGPQSTADCKPNEVEVPSVIGQTPDQARTRLAAQPLAMATVYRPAKPGERLGVVVGQIPAGGTLSSHDTVTVVLAKPLAGVVPYVVGLPIADARTRLQAARLRARVVGVGTVVRTQTPAAGSAAAPGLTVTLAAAAATGTATPAARSATPARAHG